MDLTSSNSGSSNIGAEILISTEKTRKQGCFNALSLAEHEMENVDPSFTGNQTDQADHGESTILASRENQAPHILKTQMATNYNLQCQEVFSSN